MGRFRAVATSGLLAAILALPAMAQETGLRVTPVTLMHSEIAALRGFIPAGWQSRGGLTWGDRCISYGYNIDWQASSPDGSYGVAFLPALAWGQGDFSPCRQKPLASLRELLDYQAQALWPGARMIDFRARPDLVGGQAVPSDVPGLGLDYPGITMRAWLDAGEAMFAFAAPNGQEMRGTILANASFSETRLDPAAAGLQIDMTQFPGLQLPPGPVAQTIQSGGSEWGFATWAPEGHLDLTASEAIRKSFVPTAEWAEGILRHRAVIDGQIAKGAADRAEIRRQTNAEIAGMIATGYSDRMAVSDRGYREYLESVRGVETYLDTAGQPVQLDYNYRNAWQLADGSYFLTNDPGFDPRATFNMDGMQLQTAP